MRRPAPSGAGRAPLRPAIDGTKLHANASHHANLDCEQLAREILKEAARIDAAEDELYDEQRGDELPGQLRTSEGRRAALADDRRKLARDRAKGSTDAEMDGTQSAGVELELDPEAIARNGPTLQPMAAARAVSMGGGVTVGSAWTHKFAMWKDQRISGHPALRQRTARPEGHGPRHPTAPPAH